MAQNFSRTCPHCGTQVVGSQRFCSNCGTTMDVGFSNPTAAASSGEHYSQYPGMATQRSSSDGPEQLLTPPPPPEPNTNYPPQAQQGYSQAQPGYQQPPPPFAQAQKNSSKGVLGKIGIGLGIVILLVLVICAVTGYFGWRWVSSLAASVPTVTTSGPGSSTGSTPASVPATTTNINAAVTYASVDVNILNVQQASSFSDDSSTSSSANVVRVNLREHNPTTGAIYLFYGDNFRLILPDGTSVAPVSEHDSGGIDQTVTRTNWVDFPLDKSISTDQLKLQLGGQNEAQIVVPLTGNPDVSKYQPKTTSPNSSFQYAGLNWTIANVTSSLSANGKQAEKDMRYIVVTLKVNNPTSNAYYFFANDYIRLQSGSTTNPPTNTTFDSSIAAGTTGATGTITFLMPQNSSSFTLMMLARSDTNPAATQVTKDFQI